MTIAQTQKYQRTLYLEIVGEETPAQLFAAVECRQYQRTIQRVRESKSCTS
jgi:hypothetical protein